MATVIIPNQPINLTPYVTDDCNVGDGMEYCTLLSNDEVNPSAYLQWRQTPCDGTLVTDGNFNDDPQGWTVDSGWTYVPNSQGDNLDDGSYFHTQGTADDISRTVSTANGDYYLATIVVFGMTEGALTLTLAGVQLSFWKNGVEYDEIRENGEYSLYGTMTGSSGSLVIHADTDFNGSISYVAAYRLLNEWDVNLVDMDEDPIVPQPSIGITQQEDYVTATIDLSGLDEGCYKVRLNNSCANTFGDNIVPDNDFDFPLQWTHTNESGDDTGLINVVMTGGEIVMTVDSASRVVSESISRSVSGLANGWYKLTIEIGHVAPELQHGGGNVVNFFIGSNNVPYSMGSLSTNSTYSFVINAVSLTGISDTIKVQFNRVNEGFCTGGEYIAVKSITWRPVDPFYYVSNCISVKSVHECAKSIYAVCETGTKKLGFLWDGDFKLKHYIRFLSMNPYYPKEFKDYKYSSGERSITSASKEKYKEGLIDRMDETAHDAQSTMIMCDHYFMDDIEYFVKQEDYQPEWDRTGTQKLAQARIQLRLKNSTIYNNKV